jgi:hypothetical protein
MLKQRTVIHKFIELKKENDCAKPFTDSLKYYLQLRFIYLKTIIEYSIANLS